MAWYKDGQVTVCGGSRSVVGVGTAWLNQVLPGEGLDVLDGRLQEIAEVISSTELMLVDAYAGADVAGVAYQIIPSASMTKELTRRVNVLLATHERMTAEMEEAHASTLENAERVSGSVTQVEESEKAAAESALSAAESRRSALADSDAAMAYRNEARAAREAARSDAEGAGRDSADARQALLQAEEARDAAGAFAQSVNPLMLLDRANHTGEQPISSVSGLQEALNTAVQATSETGAALAPEGTDAQRPATGSIPAGKLVIRGSTQDAADYKTEFWDRGAGVWKVFADRTWVGKQIAAAVQAVKDWVDQQIGSTIIYPNGGSAAAPANVAINSRYVMPNPFPGSRVMCLAELQIGGVWGAAGFIYAAQGGLGVAAYPHGDPGADNIIVTTGGAGLCSTGVNSGSPHILGANITTPTPCRVKVVKVKG